jgi:hypothetical protein
MLRTDLVYDVIPPGFMAEQHIATCSLSGICYYAKLISQRFHTAFGLSKFAGYNKI